MTIDLTVPKRWIEGHMAELDNREAGAEHAIRAALTDADAQPHVEELAELHATRRAWSEVLHLISVPTHHRTREHR